MSAGLENDSWRPQGPVEWIFTIVLILLVVGIAVVLFGVGREWLTYIAQ